MTYLRAALAICVLVAGSAAAAAQETRGTISGTVRDASGGVMPGVTITVQNVAMATEVTLTANAVGVYAAPYLIPGTYKITAALAGFKTAAREVELRIADRLEVDLALATGAAEETVTVTADTPLLETTNA